MKALHEGQIQFYSEISEHQISANEFFSSVLLDSLNKNFGWQKAVISYFDTEGKFLSWTSWKGIELNHAGHPYQEFMSNDIVRYQIHEEAVRDHLTYFNVVPRLYKSTDSISEEDYESAWMNLFDNAEQKPAEGYLRRICSLWYRDILTGNGRMEAADAYSKDKDMAVLVNLLRIKKFFAERGGAETMGKQFCVLLKVQLLGAFGINKALHARDSGEKKWRQRDLFYQK